MQLLEEGQSLVTVAQMVGAAVGAMWLRRETFRHAGGDGLVVKRQQRLPKLLAVATGTIAIRTSGERPGELRPMSQWELPLNYHPAQVSRLLRALG